VNKYARYYADRLGFSDKDLIAMGTRGPEEMDGPFTMALLALRGCSHVNGVSRLHGKVSRRLFRNHYPRWPEEEVPVGYVTNGVHISTWDSPPAQRLWTRACGEEGGPERMEKSCEGIARLSDLDLWNFRAEARQDLVDYVRRRYFRQLQEHGRATEVLKLARHVLNANTLTLGFARRATAYKRTNLLLHDPQRLIRLLVNRERPVQLVMAAKAHPSDGIGKEMVKEMANFASRPELFDRVVFLEDYDIDLAQHLQPGVDLWINTPRRPNEACGTSGMKVLANGGLNLSSLDGWWDEAYSPQVGWCLGDDQEHGDPGRDDWEASQLYRLLEEQIVPMFYDRNQEGIPGAWIAKVRASMATLTPRYSSRRMMQEYLENVYRPAAEAFRQRTADDAKLAKDLAEWKDRLNDNWKGLRFGQLRVVRDNELWNFQVEVYFGDMLPEDVQVELFAAPLSNDEMSGPEKVIMIRKEPLAGSVNGFLYGATVLAKRSAEDYTPRIVPYHPQAFVPLEDAHILWQR